MKTVASLLIQCLFAALFGLAFVFIVIPLAAGLLSFLWNWFVVPLFQIAILIVIGAAVLAVLSLLAGVNPMSDTRAA